MKTKLLLIALFLSVYTYGQVPTTSLIKSYTLNSSGGLVNQVTPGTGDLIPTGTARGFRGDFLDGLDGAMILNGDSFNAGSRGNSLTNREDATISFWIKTGVVNSTPQNIIQQYELSGFGGNVGWYVELVDGKIRLTSNFLKNGNQITSERTYESGMIADNKWHHVTITLERVTFFFGGAWTFGLHRYVYIDNELHADGRSGGASSLNFVHVNPSISDIKIAQGINKYTGSIDNIRIYNKALDNTERKNLYKEFYDLVPRFYVDLTANGTGSSTTWANAFTDLNKALSVVTTQDVWVKAGTYVPAQHPTQVKATSFSITQDNSRIYGGFNGTETVLSQRDVDTYKTILSGDLLNNDTGALDFNLAEKNDNSFNVVQVWEANNVVIDGFTITGGHANLTGTAGINGAAIFKTYQIKDLTIRNCNIKNNISYGGGAVHCMFANTAPSALNIENTSFDNNLARYGSGIYSYSNNNASVTANITNCLFTNNVSKDLSSTSKGLSASAMWLRGYGNNSTYTVNVVNSTFSKNQDLGTHPDGNTFKATFGLSRRIGTQSTANIYNSIFYGNTTTGGVLINSIDRITNDFQTTINVENSIGENGFTKVSSTNNTSTNDPLFVNATANDFRLQTTSPAKDAGDNTKIPSGITTDLFGNNRIYNTTVDMGAYEFDPALATRYNLTVSKTGSGTVVPNGTSMHNNGDVITLIATPITGWNFAGWSGDASGTTNPLQITMNVNKNITATFSSIQQNLTINKVGSGTVVQNPTPTNGNGYNFGDVVTLTATPAAGYHFNGWMGDIVSNSNTETITMDASKTVTATFNANPVTYVDEDATGANNGSSWVDAYTSLQTALNTVTANSDIWIAEGAYTPHAVDRNISFTTNTNNIGIYGGFNGTETALSQRDFRTNITILTGDLQGNDTGAVNFNLTDKNDNSLHVIRVATDNMILDGITIMGGYASILSPAIHSDGAAILKNDAVDNFIIKNCTIKDNISYARGCILANFSGSGNLTIENTIFDNNLATYASGIYSFTYNNASVTTNITNCLFTNNVSKDKSAVKAYAGSAMWLRGYGSGSTYVANITNCTFAKNQDIGTRAGLDKSTVIISQRSGHGVMAKNISNTIFYDNVGDVSTGRANTDYPSSISITNSIGDFSNINSSNLFNTSNVNPLFVNSVTNDFTLQLGSPAINAGDNTKIPTGIISDLLGNQRVFNTNVDMGAYEFGALSLSVDNFNVKQSSIKLYPNPTSSILNIKTTLAIKQVSVYSMLGTEVLKVPSSVINVSDLSNGMYLVKIEDEIGNTLTKRFIKE
ncbi:InlB B-repeat-containing protein [Flavivirga spongiicola]|uniref:T9SS type A sorting domain-containing protein n=1 Tax=Flavivirga spongiicola TaxID=421621 RepID=A0ABU7XWG3_9FLAO|nr:choice-of-anchor Q domain-containing protein [Flavivirga sp. MEBiC05379]MDO5979903.1 choice-of-anchor Q domain-containing protein [Flavivirga sp. MEBiC05379]